LAGDPYGAVEFFHITAEDFFVFNDPNQTGWPNEFDVPLGNGFNSIHRDLGGTTQPLVAVPPGTYLISHISFSITGAPPGLYTFFSTTTNPRPSAVADTDFNDNYLPQASFTITIAIPEPSTFALLALTGAGGKLARVSPLARDFTSQRVTSLREISCWHFSRRRWLFCGSFCHKVTTKTRVL
jgi:hypothetical protein